MPEVISHHNRPLQEQKIVQSYVEEQSELTRLHNFWDENRSHAACETPMPPECEIAVCIPAYGESIERIEALLSSIEEQNIGDKTCKIFLNVNNGTPGERPDFEKSFAINQGLLDHLQQRTYRFPVAILDNSSPDHWIEGNNVGIARNRLIARASEQFYNTGKNGITLQVDADTQLPEGYLEKVINIMNDPANADVVCVGGGVQFFFSPDTTDPQELEEYKERIKKVVTKRRMEVLVYAYNNERYVNRFYLSGCNMITRSKEIALLGFPSVNTGEDTFLEEQFPLFAKERGQRVLDEKENLIVNVAYRESLRTGAMTRNNDLFDDFSSLPTVPDITNPNFIRWDDYCNTLGEAIHHADFSALRTIVPADIVPDKLFSEITQVIATNRNHTISDLAQLIDPNTEDTWKILGTIYDDLIYNRQKCGRMVCSEENLETLTAFIQARRPDIVSKLPILDPTTNIIY